MGTTGAWTPQRRAKQAAIIANTRPWEKATGPRTDQGKAISSRNAYTGADEAAALYKNVQIKVRARHLLRAEQMLKSLERLIGGNVTSPDDLANSRAQDALAVDN